MKDEKRKEREMRRLIIENNLCRKYIPILNKTNIEEEFEVLSISEMVAIYNAAIDQNIDDDEYLESIERLKNLICFTIKHGSTNFYILNENGLTPYNLDKFIYIYTKYDFLERRLEELRNNGIECEGEMIINNSAINAYMSFMNKGYDGIIVDENIDTMKVKFDVLLKDEVEIATRLKQKGYEI